MMQSLGGLGLLDERFLADDNDDSRIRHMEPPPVGFGVKSNLRTFGKADVPVDDRAPNP
jgi:hypothetical protein